MKKIILSLFLAILLVPTLAFSAPSLASKLQGKILLAVEDRGKTYYVHSDGNRYRITKDTAQKVFEKLAIGITNENLNQIPEETIAVSLEPVKECPVKTVEKLVYIKEPALQPPQCDYQGYVYQIDELKRQLSELQTLGVIDNKDNLKNEYAVKINNLNRQILDLQYQKTNAETIVKNNTPGWNSLNLPDLVNTFQKNIQAQIIDLEFQVRYIQNELDAKLLE